MEINNRSIEQVLQEMDKSSIVRKKKSPFAGLFLIASGVLCLIIDTQLPETAGNTWSPLLIIGTIILALTGALTLSFRKKEYVHPPTGKRIFFKELFFDTTEKESLIRLMRNRNLNMLDTLKRSTHDTLKLRIATTSTGDICLIQAVAYIPYEYVDITDVHRLTDEETQTLFAYIDKKD
ncbi:MAG: LPXTG cell wall anchor domain-containing protein [Prevotellaceae bacterium]|nr:LPXTG cell wall anchor domain-containing protein [Prevotellaceae bacterium]